MDFSELIKYILPALIVLACAYLTIRQFLTREEQKQKLELAMGNQKIITPLRLAAFERVILFLERINPGNLLVRVQSPALTAKDFHRALITTIRAEYEHNMSQQIYISDESWEAVLTAKESILELVNISAQRVSADSKAIELSTYILQMFSQADENPIKDAIEKVKAEIAEILK
ncbi:MAG: hypothetical protein J6Z01_08410 [Bacteroidales bacterium]|nr:hypothetical protein [Bacteroidales bacterium]